MTEKSENTVVATPQMIAEATAWVLRSENLAALEAMTTDDIAAQIAANPDAAPELDGDWFDRAFAARAAASSPVRDAAE